MRIAFYMPCKLDKFGLHRQTKCNVVVYAMINECALQNNKRADGGINFHSGDIYGFIE